MATGDRVLITGATGFVGSAVARAAYARGFMVRVLVRAASPRANLAGFPNEIAEGDMKDEASVRRALNTQASVVTAADVDKDRRITALDLSAVRAGLSRSLATLAAPVAAAPAVAPPVPASVFSRALIETSTRRRPKPWWT